MKEEEEEVVEEHLLVLAQVVLAGLCGVHGLGLHPHPGVPPALRARLKEQLDLF